MLYTNSLFLKLSLFLPYVAYSYTPSFDPTTLIPTLQSQLSPTSFDVSLTPENTLQLNSGGTVSYPIDNILTEYSSTSDYYHPSSSILHSFLLSSLPLPPLPPLPTLNPLSTTSTTNLDFLLDDLKSDHSTFLQTLDDDDAVGDIDQNTYINLSRHISSRLIYLNSVKMLEPLSLYTSLSHSNSRFLKTSGLLGPKKVEIKKSLQCDIDYNDIVISDYCWKYLECELPDRNIERTGLTFFLDDDDRNYDDKLDILQQKSYTETIDLKISTQDSGTTFDFALMRLLMLKGEDAFLLESVFRENVWEIMELPVSLKNEREVIEAIISTSTTTLERLNSSPPPTPRLQKITDWSVDNLNKIVEELKNEMENLEGKGYYQERRIRELKLDSAWDLEGREGESGGGEFEW